MLSHPPSSIPPMIGSFPQDSVAKLEINNFLLFNFCSNHISASIAICNYTHIEVQSWFVSVWIWFVSPHASHYDIVHHRVSFTILCIISQIKRCVLHNTTIQCIRICHNLHKSACASQSEFHNMSQFASSRQHNTMERERGMSDNRRVDQLNSDVLIKMWQ